MNTRVMELFKLFKSFFIWKIVIIEFFCIQAMVNVSYAKNTRAEFHPLEKCSLLPELGEIGDRLEAMLTRGTYKLVKIHLEITGDAGPYTRGTPGPMLHPGYWVLTTGRAGRTMLLLKENSEEMSLGALSLGVTKLNITTIQSPGQCLSRLTDLQADEIVQKAILTGFANRSVALHDGAEVCSRYVNVSQTGLAKLVYKCCRLSHSNTLDCYDLKAPAWRSILFGFVVVAVLIFSSKFIPKWLFKIMPEFVTYQCNPPPGNRLAIRLYKVQDIRDINQRRFVKIEERKFIFTEFSRIEELTPYTPMEILVEFVDLILRPKELLQDSQSPVSVLAFLWHFLFRCKLQSETKSLRSCCDANVFGKFRKIKWYDFLRTVMYIIFIGLLCTPWMIRVWFYYNYELKIEEQLQHAFASRNLTYTGSLSSYLSPNHQICGIIVILAIETLLWLICLFLLKQKMNLIVQTCMFNRGATINVLDICGGLASLVVEPLERFGIVGCLVFPFWASFIALFFSVSLLLVFPIVHLSLLLLVNFIFYLIATMYPSIYTKLLNVLNEENKITNCLRHTIVAHRNRKNSKKIHFIYALELLSTLMIILSLTTLVTECIYFYVEASVYTLLGLILNHSYKSISSVLWFIVYFYDCFTPAHFAYSSFCKTIHSEIRDMIDHNEIARDFPHQEQKNRAFQVQRTTIMEGAERMKLVWGTDGFIQWNAAPRVCLFLDKYHKPYIPKRMLFALAKNIDHPSCPKQLHIIFFNSLIDFIKGAVFVYFYFVLISAFGKEMAVFAIGSVPLVIQKFLTKAHEKLKVKNNVAWRKALRKALEEYTQDWWVKGIDLVEIQGSHSYNNADDADLLVVEGTNEYFVRLMETQPVKLHV